MLYPPLRFSHITPTIHRGSYPRPVNFPYLKRLNLHTIISWTPNPINLETDPALFAFAQEHGIQLRHFPMAKESKMSKDSKKKQKQNLTNEQHMAAIQLLLQSEKNVYIHCLNGGIVTSLVVACLRKIQLWNTIAIFNEFAMFTDGVVSVHFRNFIQGFKVDLRTIMEELDDKDRENYDWLWSGLSMDVVAKHPTLCP